jgi:hypothetical protein
LPSPAQLPIGDDRIEAREAEGGGHRRESGALEEGSRVIVSAAAGEGGALRTRHRAHAAVVECIQPLLVSKDKLYSTFVLNLLLYGCENWVLTAPLRSVLTRISLIY